MAETMDTSASASSTLIFYVNGSKVTDEKPDPEMTLLMYLRSKLYLTGSKLGCGEGGCGACTVMVSKYLPETDTIKHYSVNGCLAPVCSLHGLAVTTVEGIGSLTNIHPVQERIAKFHGSQCGFCTPGIVMSMYTLLRNNDSPTAKELEEYFDGNLCRCTGYRPILDGFRTFTKEFKCAMGDQCCQNKVTVNGCAETNVISNHDKLQKQGLKLGPKIKDLKPYNSSQEPIFPPDLKVNHNTYHKHSLKFCGRNVTWLQPSTLNELIDLKTKYPSARLVVGNTEIGIETKFKNMKYPLLISTANIPELLKVSVSDKDMTIGASVTLSQLYKELKSVVNKLPEYKTRILSAILEMLKWFASHQIRNVASLSGNIMTASPISDLNPLLLAAGATVLVQSKDRGSRILTMNKDFFCGYRKTALANDELLISVTIPFTKENEYFAGYKQANRKDDDISLVNAGMKVVLSESNTINEITLTFGGIGVTAVLPTKTMEAIIGDLWEDKLLAKVSDLLVLDLPLAAGSPGGFVEYRQALALSFFFKFYVTVSQYIQRNKIVNDISAIQPMESPTTQTMQVIGGMDSRFIYNTVGKSLPHLSALQQATGEAIYVDDMTPVEGELHMALVTSSRCYAKILNIDFSAALTAPGVVDFVSATDVPGVNSLGMVMDTVFAVNEVTSQGQIIGAIIADTKAHAMEGVKLVNVQYEDKSPRIITIKDAIKYHSYYKPDRKLVIGDLQTGFSECDYTLKGKVHMNGQNHFYLETMSARALPGENGEIEVFSTTQNVAETQLLISEVLSVPSHKIVVRAKRLGGGFGGKESQSVYVAVPVAIAAKKLGKAVRCVLDRNVDMIVTGNRHAFLGKYRVGFTKIGQLTALDLELYSNCGNSLDLSFAVMERAILEVEQCYHIPNVQVIGRCCKTNITSNTAFRGFGGPQGKFIIESIVDEMATFLNEDPLQIRQRNFCKQGLMTHYNMPASGECVQRCWDLCLEKSQYHERKEDIERSNKESRWKKRGIAVTPMKFGISFIFAQMNQAGALVHIYRDGSVLVAHAGIEMGQGLHSKMVQVASEVLEIPMSQIHISETATNTVPNGQPSAASVSTDLNGMAVKDACEKLKERLKPYFKAKPDATWKEVVNTAYVNRESLSSTGFYRTPNVGYNMATQTGKPFAYFTFGAACSEVQIDCLTGDHKLLRTDIVMDIGNSINPAIDVGQIEGAFIQGYGLFLLEDIKVTPSGLHLTQGPGNYKIPGFGNIPAEFNVHLVPDSPNPAAIFASRGVGEPPLLLAVSAFFAVKEAIRAARKDAGESMKFQLNSPALPANIRMSCQDYIAKKFPLVDPDTYIPWTVDL